MWIGLEDRGSSTPPYSGGANSPRTNGLYTWEQTEIDHLNLLLDRHFRGQGTPGVTNDSGAPVIDAPPVEFSVEDMAVILQRLRTLIAQGQTRVAQTGIDDKRHKLEDQHERALARIEEWSAKCKEADNKDKTAGVMDWIAKAGALVGAIGAVVATAAVTVATGGAAWPLLAMSVAAAVGAGLTFASAVHKEVTGEELKLNLGSFLIQGCRMFLEAVGVPEDKLDAASKVMAGAIVVVLPMVAAGVLLAADPSLLGSLAGGIAELAGMQDEHKLAIIEAAFTAAATIAVAVFICVASGGMAGGRALEGIAKVVGIIARVTHGTANLVSGAGAAGGAYFHMEAGIARTEADEANADRQEIKAFLLKLQKLLEENQEELRELVQLVMNSYSVVAQMLNSQADNHMTILGNFGSRATV